MWEEVFKLALSNGIWAVLFVSLLVYQLKDSAKREKKYQETISRLNQHLDAVQDIKNELKEIRQKISRKVRIRNEERK